MTFELDIGDELGALPDAATETLSEVALRATPKARVSYYRNWFTGTMRIKVNGRLIAWSSALNPQTHISPALARGVNFRLRENDDRSLVVIVSIRPQWLAGFRPHTYLVFWRNREIARYHGY